jgi:hypothetical protein
LIHIVGYSKLLMNEHRRSRRSAPYRCNALLIRTRQTPGAITNALAREVHALDFPASERTAAPESFGART